MSLQNFDEVNPVVKDKDIQQIGQDVLAQFKTAAVRVALENSSSNMKGSWEEIVQKRLEMLEPEKRKLALQSMRKIGENPDLRKVELGRYAELDLHAPNLSLNLEKTPQLNTSLNKVNDVVRRRTFKPFHRVIRIKPKFNIPIFTDHVDSTGEETEYRYTKLRFKIDKVKCLDETGVDWLGSDQIYMGGIAIDESGDVTKIPAYKISGDFDTGETKNYRPDDTVHWFNLKEGGDNWSKNYFTILYMSEKDLGDFPEWVAELYDMAKGKIQDYINESISDDTDFAEVLVLAASYVVTHAIDWIRSWWGDDLIDENSYQAAIMTPDDTFDGDTRSNVSAVTYNGAGGRYRVWSYWELYN